MDGLQWVELVGACLAAGGLGWFGARWVLATLQLRERKKRSAELYGGEPFKVEETDQGWLWTLMVTQSLHATLRLPFQRLAWFQSYEQKVAERIQAAGLGARVRTVGVLRTQALVGLSALAIGAALGACFSGEAATLGAVAGLGLGLWWPWRALEHRAKLRLMELERHLPEMLDVLALGLRSGMTFDRAFGLYGRHFAGNVLADSAQAAERSWEWGLTTREEGLKELAASFSSPLFRRVIDTMIRSLRYGTSMAVTMEEAAAECRARYRAAREEAVAKTPVKMMLPTGVLFLPAMLLLVLGPVLLELMEGF